MAIRLNKYISDSGYCSRREADRLIEMGRVLVNGQTAKIGTMIGDEDSVEVDDTVIKEKSRSKKVYLALNKPVGITCTTDPDDPDNIVSFVNYKTRVYNVGRLDKDSEGLILMTNDGDIVNKILRSANNHEKEYLVEVDKPITDDFVKRMTSGMRILGVKTKPCRLIREGERRFKIILTQGLNRQIRRMCASLDYQVVRLKRVRIMNIKLDKLPVGHWRHLTEQEMEVLMRNITTSDGSEEASTTPNKRSYKTHAAGHAKTERPRDVKTVAIKKSTVAPAKPKTTDVSKKRSSSVDKGSAAGRTKSVKSYRDYKKAGRHK